MKKLIWVFLLMWVFQACTQSERADFKSEVASNASGGAYSSPPSPPPTSSEEQENSKGSSADRPADNVPVKEEVIERRIIKEGNLSFTTADVQKTRKAIATAVEEYKGYVSNEQVSDLSGSPQYRMSVRIPAASFEAFLENISGTATHIESKNIRALDVTEEFIDLEARIKTKLELEARYKQLLSRANSVTDVLEVEREIGNLRTEIESIQGRLKFLGSRTAYSTLDITFYEQTMSGGGKNFGYQFGQAFRNGWEHILSIFIGVTELWALILLGVGVFFMIRFVRRRRSNKAK